MDYEIILPIAFLAITGISGLAIFLFNLDKNKRIEVLKEWLLLAVVQAEKELGGGTGQVKLRYVYNLFIEKFTWLSRILSFDVFSMLVDESLDKMRAMLKTNEDLQRYITKKIKE